PAIRQIRLDELGPFRRDLARNLGIAVSGQINQHEFGQRLFRLCINANEVDGPGAPRRGTDMSYLLPQQRVDQARFAHIGTSQERELGWALRRESAWVHGRHDELCKNRLHAKDIVWHSGYRLSDKPRSFAQLAYAERHRLVEITILFSYYSEERMREKQFQ